MCVCVCVCSGGAGACVCGCTSGGSASVASKGGASLRGRCAADVRPSRPSHPTTLPRAAHPAVPCRRQGDGCCGAGGAGGRGGGGVAPDQRDLQRNDLHLWRREPRAQGSPRQPSSWRPLTAACQPSSCPRLFCRALPPLVPYHALPTPRPSLCRCIATPTQQTCWCGARQTGQVPPPPPPTAPAAAAGRAGRAG